MRLGHALGEPNALTENQRERKTRSTGIDVHSGTTGEVVDSEVEHRPAAVDETLRTNSEVEHPARDGQVDERCPHTGEDHPRAELCAVSDSTRDQRNRDD